MSPETIVGGLCFLLLLVVGAYALHLRTKRHDGHEPNSDPLFTPSREDLEVMTYNELSYLDWRDMNGSDRAAARDAYFRAKGL